jgi:hypothetical protein
MDAPEKKKATLGKVDLRMPFLWNAGGRNRTDTDARSGGF